jgi:hypothetical protein
MEINWDKVVEVIYAIGSLWKLGVIIVLLVNGKDIAFFFARLINIRFKKGDSEFELQTKKSPE